MWTDISEHAEATPGSWLQGPNEIGGIPCQVYAIRVVDNDGFQEAAHSALDVEYERAMPLCGSRMETTPTTGFDGEYIIYAHSYGD